MGKFSESTINKQFEQVYELLIKDEKISNKTDLAKSIGTYNHVINGILNGDRSLTTSQLNNLCQTFNINANYLFGLSDQAYMLTDIGGKQQAPNLTIFSHKELLKGDWELENSNAFHFPNLKSKQFGLSFKGDSMFPTLAHGDLLFCEEIEAFDDLKNNQIYLLLTDSILVKRVQKVRKKGQIKSFRLISDNSMYPPFDLEAEEVKKIAKVLSRWSKHGLK